MTILLVILIIICIILCYALYAFVQRKKLVHYDDDPVFEDETVDATKSATQAATNPSAQAATQSAAEAVSYIEDMKQLAFKMGDTVWQQYDILLATRGYGWDDIIGNWCMPTDSRRADSRTSVCWPRRKARWAWLAIAASSTGPSRLCGTTRPEYSESSPCSTMQRSSGNMSRR